MTNADVHLRRAILVENAAKHPSLTGFERNRLW
jgi:hypothetical protein